MLPWYYEKQEQLDPSKLLSSSCEVLDLFLRPPFLPFLLCGVIILFRFDSTATRCVVSTTFFTRVDDSVAFGVHIDHVFVQKSGMGSKRLSGLGQNPLQYFTNKRVPRFKEARRMNAENLAAENYSKPTSQWNASETWWAGDDGNDKSSLSSADALIQRWVTTTTPPLPEVGSGQRGDPLSMFGNLPNSSYKPTDGTLEDPIERELRRRSLIQRLSAESVAPTASSGRASGCVQPVTVDRQQVDGPIASQMGNAAVGDGYAGFWRDECQRFRGELTSLAVERDRCSVQHICQGTLTYKLLSFDSDRRCICLCVPQVLVFVFSSSSIVPRLRSIEHRENTFAPTYTGGITLVMPLWLL